MPYVTSSVDFSDSADADFETGLDISYRPTRSIFINATINPDISQIEADPTIISLTGVEPYIPEKRPFFKEGVDLLRSPIRVFYTRRIGYNRTEDDRYIYEGMDYGLKVSGRTDRYHFLGLTARTKESDEDYYVAAYQHNVGERSSVSLLAVDKEEPEDGNRALSVMGYLVLPKEYELTTQYVYIQGENIDDDDGLYIGVERGKDPFNLAVRYSQIGPDFETIHREFGFLPVTEKEKFRGWRGFDGRASYNFEFGDRFIRETGIGTGNEFYWNYDGEKVQQENELFTWISMGYFFCQVFGGRETNLEESGEVESNYVGMAGGYEPRGAASDSSPIPSAPPESRMRGTFRWMPDGNPLAGSSCLWTPE